jgi:hypothetical protein
MGGLLIGGVVVLLLFAVTAIKAVCAVGPLLDENAALHRYTALLERRAPDSDERCAELDRKLASSPRPRCVASARTAAASSFPEPHIHRPSGLHSPLI